MPQITAHTLPTPGAWFATNARALELSSIPLFPQGRASLVEASVTQVAETPISHRCADPDLPSKRRRSRAEIPVSFVQNGSGRLKILTKADDYGRFSLARAGTMLIIQRLMVAGVG